MSFKTLIFGLFLYTCLGWVGVAYWKLDPSSGWLWTAIGLIAILAYLILARVWSWWRIRRTRAASRPPAPPKPVVPVTEEAAAMSALLAEANAALARSASYPGGRVRVADLPLYLLIGPEGSGKTTTFAASGLEPTILAGQTGPNFGISTTRMANIWLARNRIFIELSGRLFSGDPARWNEVLQIVRGKTVAPFWRRIWGQQPAVAQLRGVIGFCEVKDLTAGSADVQRLERSTRAWMERLRAIAGVFGGPMPVYQVITKCDAIPYFQEFFRRLPESEAAQMLGSTLPYQAVGPAQTGYLEDQAKRLIGAFRNLYHSLAGRRVWHLMHEPDASTRPAVYEFPRELKRLRNPLVQFLTDAFRPDALAPSPVLRGYYLTGFRQVEATAQNRTQPDWPGASLEATAFFPAGDATRIFRQDDSTGQSMVADRRNLTTRSIFTGELFASVILPDRPPYQPAPVDAKVERWRRLVFTSVCGFCALACAIFLYSWAGNRGLLHSVQAASLAIPAPGGQPVTLADLQALEKLRVEVKRLRDGPGIGLHWGLYSGNRIFDAARASYFSRFQRLLLNDLNGGIVQRLAAATPAVESYPAVYDGLRAHLSISSGACTAAPELVAKVLKDQSRATFGAHAVEWQGLADQQIDFYASELRYGNPCRLMEDAAARDHAREFLRNAAGVDAFYSAMLAEAAKSSTVPHLEEMAPNWRQVLAGPSEPTGAFTPQGWAYADQKSKEFRDQSLEACAGGETATSIAGGAAIRQRFLADYAEAWRKYVAGFSVASYRSAEDAGRKLDILADRKSPLLALFALVANQTNLSAPSPAPGLQKKLEPMAKALGLGKADPPEAVKLPEAADIAAAFQPVHWVVPPGTDNWVQERNQPFLDAVSHLAQSMHALGGSKGSDPAIVDQASQSYQKAMESVQQLARGFKTVRMAGMDEVSQRLLTQPILAAQPFIRQPDVSGPINRGLSLLCSKLDPLLRKYPFLPNTDRDVSLEELTAVFAPNGAIAKFRDGTLADYLAKEGTQWKAKDPAKKPQITGEMLAFLNQAQAITDALFADGSAVPRLSYNLRPHLSAAYKGWTLALKIDGASAVWRDGETLRKTFRWPAADRNDAGVDAHMTDPSSAIMPFGSQAGLWAIFRLMADGDPHPPDQQWIQWSKVRAGRGREQAIAPIRMDFADAGPGIAPLMNLGLFSSIRCPKKAVEQ